MKRGKSQYSIEFLVTYGWALLIIGIVIGAIYTFGWFNPSTFLPQKCTFYGQVGCKDFSLTETEFNLSLVNNFGSDLYISRIDLLGDGEEICSKEYTVGNLVYWSRGTFNDTLSINLNDDSLCNTALKNEFINSGSRSVVTAKVFYFSPLSCPDCVSTDPHAAACMNSCVHNSAGHIIVNVDQ
jgi:hypothetical protein